MSGTEREDIVQETLIDLASRAERLALLEPEERAAYAARAAIRAYWKWKRALRRRQHLETQWVEHDRDCGPDSACPDPERLLSSRQTRSTLEALVQRLPERLRDVFVARELELATTTEAAERLRLTEGTVKTRLREAWAHLADMAAPVLEENVSLHADVIHEGPGSVRVAREYRRGFR